MKWPELSKANDKFTYLVLLSFLFVLLLLLAKKFLHFSKKLKKSKIILAGAQAIIEKIKTKTITSSYSHSNIISENQTIFEVDCSGFVNHVLISQNLKQALIEVQNYANSFPLSLQPKKALDPWPHHYVAFFDDKKASKTAWHIFDDARLLEPGDIIAYTPKEFQKSNDNKENNERGYHMMIVAERPSKKDNKPHLLFVPIFDSTRTKHGKTDNRGINGGIGKATICLKMDRKGLPLQLKWHPEAEYSLSRNIKMAAVI